MGIPDHLTCLLRDLYAGQEATVRTRHGTTDGFQIGKGVHKGCILSPWLFNLYAECIIGNARLKESHAGIKIGRRNISNFSYADDNTLMAAAAAKSLQSCLTLCDPIDCSLPGSSVHGILQARALEWAAMPSSSGSSHPRPTDWRSADEQDLKLISKHIQF